MMTRMKIKKGDTVFVLHGKDRGKTGKVVRLIPDERKIVVEGVGARMRHIRPRRAGEKGQRITVHAPIWASNARVVCPACGKGARIGYRTGDNGKVRVCKKCKADL